MRKLRCLFVALTLLVLAAQGAMAQKTIMFKSPWSVELTHLAARGVEVDVQPVPGTVAGMSGWYSYTIPAGYWGLDKSFFFIPKIKVGTEIKDLGGCYDLTGVHQDQNTCKQNDPATNFAAPNSWSSDTLWIIPDMRVSSRVALISAKTPRMLYFLNPDDWVQGMPQIKVGAAVSQMMLPDPDRCGWFYALLLDENGPFNEVLFDYSLNSAETIGAKGIDDATPIDLDAEFTLRAGATTLFFDPILMEFTDIDPGSEGICSYNLAAIIRDFHHTTHPNFYLPSDANYFGYSGFVYNDLATYTNSSRGYGTKNPCEAITNGIVKSDLNTATRKPVYNEASNCFGKPAGVDGTKWFDWLFKGDPEEKINAEYCYDLPFSKTNEGLWEYDSQNEADKGFFPLEPNAVLQNLKGENKLPLAPFNTPASAQCGAPIVTECAEYYDTLTAAEVMAGPGAFGCLASDKAKIDDWFNWGARNCTMNKFHSAGYQDGVAADGSVTKHDGVDGRNQHFCFESHAEFTYSPGQTFTFRGDDDIWVFINNKLVVDNGGLHLPAPGYVKLDTMQPALNAGKKYYVDIFFCDRQPTSSNVRIKTSMYFEQKKGLFGNTQTDGSVQLCMLEGGGGSCSAIISGTTGSEEKCGADIAGKLEYFVVKRGATKDTSWLSADENPTYCSATGKSVKCYGGITLDVANSSVAVDKAKLNMPGGTYTVYARIIGTSTSYAIAKFTTQTTVAAITTAARSGYYNKEIFAAAPTPSAVVAGKLTPVYFSSGTMDNGVFVVNDDETGGGIGSTFSLGVTAGFLSDETTGAKLKVYSDTAGQNPVLPTDVFTIPTSGLCTLWVAGNYEASDDYSYTLTVAGSKATPLSLNVVQPTLKFTDLTFKLDVQPKGLTQTDGSGLTQGVKFPYVGEEIGKWLVAVDPTTGAVCTTCNFSLYGKGFSTNATIAQPVVFIDFEQKSTENGLAGGLVAGYAEVAVAGGEVITDPDWASFTVQGPSAKHVVTWDSLRFREPPVPIPTAAHMYDKNGDGYGDSLVIWYHRAIKADSLADFMEIWWPESSTDSIYLSKEDLKNYWRKGYPDSMIVIADRNFSAEIMTSGVGRIKNTATFYDGDVKQTLTVPFNRTVNDKIAPVVAKASYIGAEKCGGTSLADACRDKVTLQFSEPVVLDSVGAASVDSALRYEIVLIGSQKSWQVAPEPISKNMTDTTAVLYFSRYKDSGTPVAGDSIRLRGDGGAALRLFRDVEHNFPSARQVGVRIEGVKPLSIQSVVINTLDITDPAVLARLDSAPVKVYAVPVDVSIDSLAKLYPGTVGQLIKVDVAGKAYTFDPDVTPQQIKLYTDSRYFSNLGSYVAKGSSAIGCDHEMFKNDCLKNPAYLYVAWNMITDDKRFVGSGAYISTLQFHWTLDGRTFDDTDVTELLGVRRGVGIVK